MELRKHDTTYEYFTDKNLGDDYHCCSISINHGRSPLEYGTKGRSYGKGNCGPSSDGFAFVSGRRCFLICKFKIIRISEILMKNCGSGSK